MRKRLRMLRNGLIFVETALSVILLVGAGLMLRSFSRLMNSDFGFNPERVLTLRIAAPSYLKEKPQQIAYYTRLLDQVQSIPGPECGWNHRSAAARRRRWHRNVRSEGPAVLERQMVKLRTASPGVFHCYGSHTPSRQGFL